jgi:plastocyanin
MTSIAGVKTKLLALGVVAFAVLTWSARAYATAPTCDMHWTDDRTSSSPTITFPNGDNTYSPSEILIKSGQTVVWKGNTSSDTFANYPLVDASGQLWGTFSVPEQSWPFTYTKPGAWEYYASSVANMAMAGIVCVAGSPIASFTHSPNPAKPGQTLTFSGSASHAAESFANITDYQWDLGTGSFVDNGSTASITHAFSKAGVYKVRLRVTDSLGMSRIKTENVSIGAAITQAPRLKSTTVTETSRGAAPLGVENPNAAPAHGQVTLTQTTGSGPVPIGNASFSDPAHGTVTVSVLLSSKAKTYLKTHKSLSAKAKIVLSANGTSKSQTFTITIDR